jgi:peptidyl-prolyl cis-trans isomerase SurA
MSKTCRSTTKVASLPPAAERRPLGRLLASCLAAGLVLVGASTPVNRIVLQVNARIATLQDYERMLAQRQQQLERAEMTFEERETLRGRLPAETMRALFEEMLLLSRADQMSVRVSEAEIERMLDEIQRSNQIPTREDFQRAVAQTGQSWQQFRTNLADQQRIQEVVGREVNARVKLEEDDLRIYYRDQAEQFRVPEQRRLLEIVVLDSSPLSDAERLELGKQIAARMNQGEAAATIASEMVKAGTTSDVIALEWVPKGDLDPALEAVIDGLKPGEASQPVSGRGGLHVVQLLERKPSFVRPFDEVQDEIFRRERARLFEKEFPKFLRELEQVSYVVAKPPPGAESFRRTSLDRNAEEDPLAVFQTKPTDAKPTNATPPPKP